MTTNDDNVFALDGATGKVIWHYKPPNSGLFKNFGIVANRGLAYCDGASSCAARHAPRRAETRRRRAARSRRDRPRRPGAASNYGYSETSAPICANHRVIVGAAGSEYGDPRLRDGVHDRPARRPGRTRSGRSRRTSRPGGAPRASSAAAPSGRPSPSTRRRTRVYFGTGSATPLYFPALRPGADPRTDSLIAVDLTTGQHQVVAAADRRTTSGPTTSRSRRSSTRQGRRQDARRRLGRDDGRRLVRVRRKHRHAVLRAREGDRPRRASAARPGPAGDGLPVVARRPELLAGLVRPGDELRVQRRRRDGRGARSSRS